MTRLDLGLALPSVLTWLYGECIYTVGDESLCKALSASNKLIACNGLNSVQKWEMGRLEVLDRAGSEVIEAR